MPGGPDQQYALGNASAQLLEFLRVFQKVDDFVKLFLRLIDSGDIFERRFLLLRGQKARAGFPEAQGFVSAGLHLLHHENPEENEEDERSEVKKKRHPIGVLHFLVVIEDVVILQELW